MVPARSDSGDARGQEEADPLGPARRLQPASERGGELVMLNGIDHVGIAVEDLDAAVELYRRTLGLEPAHRDVVESQGVEEVLFEVGDSRIQLVGALGPDTPVGRFLAKRGPGLHHLGLGVDDVAATLQTLRAAGVPLVDESPRSGSRGTTIAFIHPAGMGGVLVELVQERR